MGNVSHVFVKMKKKKILITAPHSYCESRTKRDCDRSASIASRVLKVALGDSFDVNLHENELLRKKMDMNRSMSREYPYRKELTTILKENSDINFHFDVHSFPPVYRKQDIYFIVSNDNKNYEYTNTLRNYLEKKMNRKYEIYRGPKPTGKDFTGYPSTNDITDESLEMGFKAVLVKFNEGLKITTLNLLVHYIKNWLLEHLSIP